MKTDYSLRVLIFLQKNKGRVKIQTIASTYNISKNHLSVAVNRLSELGYIDSFQGPNGGIEINKNALKRSVRELLVELEEFNIVECFNSKTNTCTLNPKCKLKKMISDATKGFLKEFEQYKIEDLV